MQKLLLKALQSFEQRKEEALKSASYIKTREKREAFLRKANYELSIFEQLIQALQEGEQQEELIEEPAPSSPKTKETMSPRAYSFFYGKEAARSETIRRAQQKWNF